MTLLLTLIAALCVSVLWYYKDSANHHRLGSLALIYWGASLMWFVDAIFEYAELGMDYFLPDHVSMINDAFLGCCVIVLGVIIWLIMLLKADPKHRLR